ncbi:MAG: hypothetical protein V1694_13470 [Candidatus Eisenbacteria bacterium]
MWTRLRALPPYFGGTRRLLGRIFKHMPKPDEAPVLVDAFLDGGAVSLFGKGRGYRVTANVFLVLTDSRRRLQEVHSADWGAGSYAGYRRCQENCRRLRLLAGSEATVGTPQASERARAH